MDNGPGLMMMIAGLFFLSLIVYNAFLEPTVTAIGGFFSGGGTAIKLIIHTILQITATIVFSFMLPILVAILIATPFENSIFFDTRSNNIQGFMPLIIGAIISIAFMYITVGHIKWVTFATEQPYFSKANIYISLKGYSIHTAITALYTYMTYLRSGIELAKNPNYFISRFNIVHTSIQTTTKRHDPKIGKGLKLKSHFIALVHEETTLVKTRHDD